MDKKDRWVNTEIEKKFQSAKISDNAKIILKKRYLRKNKNGEITETSDEMFKRVANALSKPEINYGKTTEEVSVIAENFYKMMASLKFLPNSPTLMNAGTGAGTLSACFVLPLTDSMEGIMAAAKDAALVQKFGGGTGFSLSEIRPKNSPIKTTHGKACGPIAVLKHLSSVSTLVTQGGKRDGANMAVMDVHHPDILDFIDCKKLEGTIHNFNISVGVSDEFMEAVKNNTDYTLRFLSNPANPESKMIEVGSLNAREVFEKIIEGAWRNGEPGMIFLDEVNRNSPVIHLGKITATNPCGEQPLLPNESCNLGSIDVGKFVKNESEKSTIDWKDLENIIRLSIRFLDNVIDANKYAVNAIEDMTRSTRKLGLGVMGFADMLIKLGIPYDSKEGTDLGKKMMIFLKEISDSESINLANERGAYPSFNYNNSKSEGVYRNACRLTVAPTGTISMIAGASSGIEPLFSLAFRKQNILGGETLYYVDENFENISKDKGFYSEDLLEFLSGGGSLQERDDVPKDVKRLFRVSSDISPEDHVLMQSAFQISTDAGISKTINFPNEATIEDVESAYMLAWETKCKGITVYRAGSREKEVLTTGHSNENSNTSDISENFKPFVSERDRPQVLSGITRRVRTGRGNLFVTVNMSIEGRPFEIFATHGKAGGNDAAMAEAVSRMASLSLRCGINPEDVVAQLRGITDVPSWDTGELIRSVPDAIALVLDQLINSPPQSIKDLNEDQTHQSEMFSNTSQKEIGLSTSTIDVVELDAKIPVTVSGENLCPECSSGLAHEEGCLKCYSCGFSKC